MGSASNAKEEYFDDEYATAYNLFLLILILIHRSLDNQIRAPPDPLANAPRVLDAEHHARHRADQPERVRVLVALGPPRLLAERLRRVGKERPALDERVNLLDGQAGLEPPHDALPAGHPDRDPHGRRALLRPLPAGLGPRQPRRPPPPPLLALGRRLAPPPLALLPLPLAPRPLAVPRQAALVRGVLLVAQRARGVALGGGAAQRAQVRGVGARRGAEAGQQAPPPRGARPRPGEGPPSEGEGAGASGVPEMARRMFMPEEEAPKGLVAREEDDDDEEASEGQRAMRAV